MHPVTQYFAHVPDSHRIGLLIFTIALFWHLENRQDWRLDFRRWRHALTNARFTLVDGLVQVFLGLLLLKELDWIDTHNWGLVRHLPFADNSFVHFMAVFLILDLLEYCYHVVMHRYGYLWRFHAVHHADPHVDVSTVLREHPGETFIRLTFLLLWVLVTGPAFWALMARQFIQIIANVAAHANYRLPESVDRVVSYVLVTPNVHHVHHHMEQPYTDSNYGDVLSIWDRLFGTYSTLAVDKIVFGLDTHPEPTDGASFNHLLLQPFQPGVADEEFPSPEVWSPEVNPVSVSAESAR
ncbi:sterol desaturase family protein [Larkinella terrae]|uniref:Sterol desaturase family protein n=1 Tax=Larkinella terrae TaxID=2025311 RepID=A0A7K0EED6_9BACT|nr:sterol desaturase family protein [Larkinella terrae]MRS60062.1 sterol desaturase family protein [Larkinella terrae]